MTALEIIAATLFCGASLAALGGCRSRIKEIQSLLPTVLPPYEAARRRQPPRHRDPPT